MPPLVAFGREWEIGSDELVYPGIRSTIFRLPWLIGTGVVYLNNYKELDCSEGGHIKIFIIGILTLLHLFIVNNLLLIYNSSLGTIMNDHKRRFVPIFIYNKMALYLIEIGWNVLGAVWYFRGLFNCLKATDTLIIIEGVLVCNWVYLFLFFSYWVYQYDPLGRYKSHDDEPNLFENTNQIHVPETRRFKQWEKRLRCLSILCCSKQNIKSDEMQTGFSYIARYFSFVLNDRGLVSSDLLCGTVVGSLKTELERVKKFEYIYKNSPFSIEKSINYDPDLKTLILPTTERWNSLTRIRSLLKYALAIFTVPAALTYRHRRKKFLKYLCCGGGCCTRRDDFSFEIENDFCCFSRTRAIKAFIPKENIVYVSFTNENFMIPFYVSLDHDFKNIVITTRGTFSFADCLLDGINFPESMEKLGFPPTFKAHRGMLNASILISKKLEELQIIEKILVTYPDYTILTTGISLGAGVAGIMGMILRKKYPDLKSIPFSPPGALLSIEAAEYCDSFVTSIAYQDDMVLRMRNSSVLHLVDDIESVLWDCETPKYKIKLDLSLFLLGIRNLRAKFNENYRLDENEGGRGRANSNGSTTDSQQVFLQNDTNRETSINTQALKENVRRVECESFLEMFAPGRVLYITETPPLLTKTKRKKRRKNEPADTTPLWEIKWADRDEFKRIIISKRMLLDHLPFRLAKSLRYLTKFDEFKK